MVFFNCIQLFSLFILVIFIIKIKASINMQLIQIKINHIFIIFSFICFHLNFIMNILNYYNNYNELPKIISLIPLQFLNLYTYHKLIHVVLLLFCWLKQLPIINVKVPPKPLKLLKHNDQYIMNQKIITCMFNPLIHLWRNQICIMITFIKIVVNNVYFHHIYFIFLRNLHMHSKL